MKEGRKFATKTANAQEAHEAIRPTHIENDPAHIKLDGDDLRLYKLIWERTVASQMQAAKVQTTTYTFVPKDLDQKWQTKGQVILFDGFLKLYEEGTDDEEEKEGEVTLPAMQKMNRTSVSTFYWNTDIYASTWSIYRSDSRQKTRIRRYWPSIDLCIDDFNDTRSWLCREKTEIPLPYFPRSHCDRIPRKEFCTNDWLQIHSQRRRRIW
jgi:hypothetical protein